MLPPSYRRISHGDEISIGTRRFKVITGGGHALDQVMLYCAADKLFLSADQVLSKISPNVSVWAVEPDQNSLGEYLASLASLTTTLPYDVIVLPGHGVPFYGLKTRIKQLADHHEERCRLIADACRDVPQTSKELVPVVFHKHVLDAHQMGFAAGELIAHVNYMLVEGRLTAAGNRRRAALQDDLSPGDWLAGLPMRRASKNLIRINFSPRLALPDMSRVQRAFRLDIKAGNALKRSPAAPALRLQVLRWITASSSVPPSTACMTSGATGYSPISSGSRAGSRMRCGIPRKAGAMS